MPKNAFLVKNSQKMKKKSKKFQNFFSKSICNHSKRILRRKYGFQTFFHLAETEVGISNVHSDFGGDGGRHS